MENSRQKLCAVETSESLLVKRPEYQRWREKLLKSKWPHMNEEITIGKVLSKIPLNRETGVPSHTVLNANGKTRSKMQNGDRVRPYVGLKSYKQNGEDRNCL
jgi:hypothetical protein